MEGKRRYEEYLASDHWAAMKFFKAQMEAKQCVACLATDQVDLHHMLYADPLEDARLEDTCWLCRLCHNEFHRKAGTTLKGIPRHLLLAETVRVILSLETREPLCGEELHLMRVHLQLLGLDPDRFEACIVIKEKPDTDG